MLIHVQYETETRVRQKRKRNFIAAKETVEIPVEIPEMTDSRLVARLKEDRKERIYDVRCREDASGKTMFFTPYRSHYSDEDDLAAACARALHFDNRIYSRPIDEIADIVERMEANPEAEATAAIHERMAENQFCIHDGVLYQRRPEPTLVLHTYHSHARGGEEQGYGNIEFDASIDDRSEPTRDRYRLTRVAEIASRYGRETTDFCTEFVELFDPAAFSYDDEAFRAVRQAMWIHSSMKSSLEDADMPYLQAFVDIRTSLARWKAGVDLAQDDIDTFFRAADAKDRGLARIFPESINYASKERIELTEILEGSRFRVPALVRVADTPDLAAEDLDALSGPASV